MFSSRPVPASYQRAGAGRNCFSLLMDPNATPEEALKRCWGYDSFKPLQREPVDATLSGRDCLVVLPTGGGKSLCYQIPAAMGRGLVLVVSPLIALMDDQVAAARA